MPIKSPSLEAISARISRAKRELARSRSLLARFGGKRNAASALDHAWAPIERAAQAHGARLLARNGVLGVSIGLRRRGGVQTDEPVVVVFVRKKLSPASLRTRARAPIPRNLRTGGHAVAVDVVELGELERLEMVGDSIGARHLRNRATIGGVVRSSDGSIAVLTAMHATGKSEWRAEQGVGVRMCIPSLRVDSTAAVQGYLDEGSTTGIDAAKIRLVDPTRVTFEVPEFGALAGPRPTAIPGDIGSTVWFWGARSGLRQGVIEHANVPVPSMGLAHAILVRTQSEHGDSGAALFDRQKHVLGLLVGRTSGESPYAVFCAIGDVLASLHCRFMIT